MWLSPVRVRAVFCAHEICRLETLYTLLAYVASSAESEGQDSHTSMKQGTAAPPLASECMCSVLHSTHRSL